MTNLILKKRTKDLTKIKKLLFSKKAKLVLNLHLKTLKK